MSAAWLKIRLGKFSALSIEAGLGGDIVAVTLAAARHYARGLRSGRRPVGLPNLARLGVPDSDLGAEFDLLLPADVAEPLADEASRREAPIELIVSHAVLVFLADLDASGSSRRTAEEAAARSRYRVDAQRPESGHKRRGGRDTPAAKSTPAGDRIGRSRPRGGGRLSRR